MFTQQAIYSLVTLLIFVTYTQQQKDPAYLAKWQKNREACAAEGGVDLAAVKKAWDENKIPTDEKIKCYFKCVNLKTGIIDASGEVIDAELGKLAGQFNDKATQEEIVAECGPIKGADLCETSYKLTVCVKAAILD